MWFKMDYKPSLAIQMGIYSNTRQLETSPGVLHLLPDYR